MEVLLILALLLFAGAQERKTAAVMEFSGSGIESAEIQTLTSKLGSELVKQDVFVILERAEMGLVLQEQGFQQTGCTSAECAVEVGQVLGVQFIVTGSIGKLEDMYYVETRLIDVGSSKITKSVDRNVHGTLKDVLITALPEIASELSGKIVPVNMTTSKSSKEAPIKTVQPEIKKKKRVVPILLSAVGVIGAGVGAFFIIQKKKDSGEPELSTGQIQITIPAFKGAFK